MLWCFLVALVIFLQPCSVRICKDLLRLQVRVNADLGLVLGAEHFIDYGPTDHPRELG